ncbi:MAG: DUF2752 domain-containing protein [Clostridia bacterium]|nr:DUF2752 domain-containing protein [Clostridia bacterium]
MINRRSAKNFLLFHALVLCLLLLFPLYRAVAAHMTQFMAGCMVHDYFFVYCPLCGGTRALEALLHFDLLAAFRFNFFVAFVAVLAAVLDVIALIRLLRGKERLLILPGWGWIALAVFMILYAVLRNYLMIAHGYDPVGDLGRFWQGLRR